MMKNNQLMLENQEQSLVQKKSASKGSITIFLALCAGLIIAVVMAEIEAARYAAISATQKTALVTVCKSMLAEYNIPLFEMYDIFAVDGTNRNLSEDMQGKVINNSGAGIFQADIANVCVTDLCALTDESYKPLIKEIVQYMATTGIFNIGENMVELLLAGELSDVEKNKDQITNQLISDKAQAAIDESDDNSQMFEQVDKPKDPRESLSELLKRGLLSLVLPEGFQISDAQLETGGRYESYSDNSIDFTSVRSVINQMDSAEFQLSGILQDVSEDMIVLKYLQNKFKNAVEFQHITHDTRLKYELEYFICGHQQDNTNLLDTTNRLVLMRTVFNYAYLFKDTSKGAAVHSLASSLAAAVLMPWLEPVIYSLIMVAWSYAEAIIDVRTLFEGQKVPIFKNVTSWNLSLEGLTSISVETVNNESLGRQNDGLSYNDYLMILLLFTQKQKRMERMTNLITANVRMEQGYGNFSMDNCFYSVGCITEYNILPLFWSSFKYVHHATKSYQWSECY